MGRPGSQQGAAGLTGLVAHTAQNGPDLDAECLLSLLQALVHKIHNLIRGDVPSVERGEGRTLGQEKATGSQGTGAGRNSLAPRLCLLRRHIVMISSPYAAARFLRCLGIAGSQ